MDSLARVMGGAGQGEASHHAAHATALQVIHHQRLDAQQRYSTLISAILSHEKDLQVSVGSCEECGWKKNEVSFVDERLI